MRRAILVGAVLGLTWICLFETRRMVPAQQPPVSRDAAQDVNLAPMASVSSSFPQPAITLATLNEGYDPRNSQDRVRGVVLTRQGAQGVWLEYAFSAPIRTNRSSVYWFSDGRNARVPAAYRLKYWNGSEFVEAGDMKQDPPALNQFQGIKFAEIHSDRLRLEIDADGGSPAGVLEWKVYDSGASPQLAPIVDAGPDRIVVNPGKTYLNPSAKFVAGEKAQFTWSKATGPGEVTFADPASAVTAATFSQIGNYELKFTASLAPRDGAAQASAAFSGQDTLTVRVEAQPPTLPQLARVETGRYSLDSRLWNDRVKALIVGWIPHCYTQLSNLELREGGINNFIQAANKLAGRPSTPNSGYPFTDAYVYNTMESMCLALMYDARGDAEVEQAQKAIRAKLDEWIPLVLAAQEPDGYLQTRFTRDPRNPGHWTIRGDHEGYVAGYFLEAAIAHFRLTDGKDRRMYDAAVRLADCWETHLGPAPKKAWYDGHEEMEYALIRFAGLVNEVDGAGKGDKYVALSRFLMDSRRRGSSYDQSHLPVAQQYEAAGHAVRAVYLYTAMSEMAAITRDNDYQSAVRSLWDNVVNRKYYLTGGVGSGETSEGFGPDYSLRNSAYCESCSSCGEIFFQASLERTYHDARYADLFEQTLYNALLGSVDLDGTHFRYTNPLDERGPRSAWHVCPCCVGNIPRTLLQLPTWTYAKSADSIYVNLFVGSDVTVDGVGGRKVRMVQQTDYPWSGDVTIGVNPEQEQEFTVFVRVPNRQTSDLYLNQPQVQGLLSLAVNGQVTEPKVERGYAAIKRTWKQGDKIQLSLPMPVQRVHMSEKVAANRGRVALVCGPLVFNVESVDGELDRVLPPDAALTSEWREDLLRGVRVITGKYADGSPMVAVPNYARNNRGDNQRRSVVWIREQ